MRLQDDPLVDVFLCLCRATLDTLEISNRRFMTLVRKRAKVVCLRAFEVAELGLDDLDGHAQFVETTRLVTAPTRHGDGCFHRETFTLEDAPAEQMWLRFVNRLRHSIVTDRLAFAVPTDTPEFVESIKGTVLLKKGLRWAVRQAIDLDNAFRFLSSFTGLQEVELWCHERFSRFTDDWFKLFETLGIYRVRLHHRDCRASAEALASFLFGASSAPGSEKRVLDNAAIFCTSSHRTTCLLGEIYCDDLMSILAKYDDPHHSGSYDKVHAFEDERGRQHRGRVLNFHRERFRVQVFCYSSGLHIRRARAEDVDFFPVWL